MNKFKKSIVMYHDNSGQQDIFEVLGKCSPNILKLSNETVFFQSEEPVSYTHLRAHET